MSYMADYGETATDNGYRVIPIAPGTKRPGRYDVKAGWVLYADWSRHCDRPTKPFEITIWKRWPDTAIGIACGNVVGIDIDILDATWAHKIEGLARQMLGDTPLVRIGRHPKRLMVYKAETPFGGWKPHPIEILAKGQQFVAYADHPDTGSPYQWTGDSPCDVDVDSLPVVTEQQCKDFAAKVHALLPDTLKPARVSNCQGSGDTSALGLRGTIEAVTSALQSIPNDDVPWDDWFAVGMSVKGAVGDDGWRLFSDWSARSNKHDDKNTSRLWKGMRPKAKGAGSLYHMAGLHGWAPPAEVILNAEMAELPQADPSALIKPRRANLAGFSCDPTPPNDDPDLPPDPAPERQAKDTARIDRLLKVPGIVGDLTGWITASAISPQPFLALGAALAAVGALMGRRYRTTTNLRSNLYVVGVAGSGGGKDHPRACLREAFYEAGLFDYMGGNKIASGQAILSALNRHPSILFQLDEFGHLLNQILSKRAAAHHQQIWSTLTELYTSAGGIYQGTEYADQRDKPRQDIVQPCACLNATTVPGPLWQALENGALGDGSLARFLIFRSPVDYPDRAKGGLIEPPESVVEGLRRIAAGVPDYDYGAGNLASLMHAKSNPRPYVVPLSLAAARAFDQLEAEQVAQLRHFDNAPQSAIIARMVENAAKLAMIYAVSKNPSNPVVSETAADWAADLVDHCTNTLIQDAERFIADNETEAKSKRLLRILEDNRSILWSQLVRKTQWLSRRERAEIITSICESGRASIIDDHASSGKSGPRAKRVIYVEIGDEDSSTVH